MKKPFKSFLCLAVTAVAVAVCQPGVAEAPQEQPYLLPVMQTTDMHGYIVQNAAGTIHYRLAYIADKALDIRGRGEQYRRERLLLLDGGDVYQGACISNLLGGQPLYVSMDAMEYDAVALGNHEFDWDVTTTVDADATLPDYTSDGTLQNNLVPIVCATLYRNGVRSNLTRDYVIVEKEAVNAQGEVLPVKVGVIGFAPDYSSSILPARFSEQGFSIREDYDRANSLAASLEESGQCDVTVLLIHGEAKRAAERLGASTPIDLVLGGHTHQTVSGVTSWGLPYLQGGRYCEHYAYADLSFGRKEDGTPAFQCVQNQQSPAVDQQKDLHTQSGQNAEDLAESILEVSDKTLAAVAPQLNEVIGYIGIGATTYYIGDGNRNAVISNWMCDILRKIGKADVAFVNAGGIRTSLSLNGASRRDVTVGDVYEIFPFGNVVYVYSLTYADLLKVFQFAMTSGGSGLFSRMTGMVCRYTNYKVLTLEKTDGTVLYEKSKWKGDWASRPVTLAVSEYIATSVRTDNYTGLPNPLTAWNQSELLTDKTLVDNENAIRVLKAEAAANGGRLWLDNKAHFIYILPQN